MVKVEGFAALPTPQKIGGFNGCAMSGMVTIPDPRCAA